MTAPSDDRRAEPEGLNRPGKGADDRRAEPGGLNRPGKGADDRRAEPEGLNRPGENADPRRLAPAVARNRDALLAVLRGVLPARGLVLEIASGTGEHALHIAAALPGLTWQPSDPDADSRASIDAWCAGQPNIRPALAIDVTAWPWPIDRAGAMLCVNMIHIAPWAATLGLMRGAAALLPPGAPLALYGPYLRAGIPTAQGNLDFDASLRARNPEWGIRALEDVEAAAEGFALAEVVEMPANNLTLVFRRLG